MRPFLFLAAACVYMSAAFGQGASGAGYVIASGGVGDKQAISAVAEQFTRLAGGRDKQFVLIPTAIDDARLDREALLREYKEALGTENITILHTRDRQTADSEQFIAPLKRANGVWITGGQPQRLVAAYVGTRTQRALQAVVDRGGVVEGDSAGAMILGAVVLFGERWGAPNPKGGFAILPNIIVSPHLSSKPGVEKWTRELVDTAPNLTELGIDDDAAVLLSGRHMRVIVGKALVHSRHAEDLRLTVGQEYEQH